MNPGLLNKRVTIEAPVETPDGAGGLARSFSAVATVWARFEPSGGTEVIEATCEAQRLGYRVTIRRRAGLTAGHRLNRGGRLFDVHAVEDHEEWPHLLVLSVREITP